MSRHEGFTLLELMVTLVVMGIMASFALPAMNQFMEQQRVRTTSTNMANAITFARNEAVRQNITVGVTGANISSAGQLANATNSWTEGILVYGDVDNDHQYKANTDRNLRVIASSNRPNAENNKLDINSKLIDTNGDAIAGGAKFYILPNGQMARLNNNNLIAGDFYLQMKIQSANDARYSSVVLIDPTGLVIKCNKKFLENNSGNQALVNLCKG